VDDPRRHRHELLHRLFAEGRIRASGGPVLAVPRPAVLWPKGWPVVYVEKASGTYEPREIELGRSGDDVWEVVTGLKEGEKVVISGNLLLDSQAQINRPPRSPSAASPAAPLTKAQVEAAGGLFQAEARLVELLASDKLTGWKPAVEQLRTAVAKLGTEFGPEADSIRKASRLPVSGEIAAIRAGFYPFAEATSDFALRLRQAHPESSKVFVFECGMAGGAIPGLPKESGRWVQLSPEIRNPWYGDAMLTCGTEIK
jgi:Cu(I)/Ag(I) efflux system membrane fusion protein